MTFLQKVLQAAQKVVASATICAYKYSDFHVNTHVNRNLKFQNFDNKTYFQTDSNYETMSTHVMF